MAIENKWDVSAEKDEHAEYEKLREEVLSRKIDGEALDKAFRAGLINQKEHNLLSSKLNEELKKESNTDSLTGLYNRRDLESKLSDALRSLGVPEERRKHAPNEVVVVRLDINRFKVFNEHPYNHADGDQALVAFANQLKSVTKAGQDEIFRVGGDEFVIIMPIYSNGKKFNLEEFKKRINDNITVDIKDKPEMKITATVGAAVSKSGEHKTARQLLEEADTAEREAKRQ
jgi:diguanylate cyclase (GGDEF)-like protein